MLNNSNEVSDEFFDYSINPPRSSSRSTNHTRPSTPTSRSPHSTNTRSFTSRNAHPSTPLTSRTSRQSTPLTSRIAHPSTPLTSRTSRTSRQSTSRYDTSFNDDDIFQPNSLQSLNNNISFHPTYDTFNNNNTTFHPTSDTFNNDVFRSNNTSFRSSDVEATPFHGMDNVHQICSWLCKNPNVLLLAYNMYSSMHAPVTNGFNFISPNFNSTTVTAPHMQEDKV
jgi:hypothetical protein